MKEDVARVIGRLINERAMPVYIYRQGWPRVYGTIPNQRWSLPY
jgi:hypothetical protein